MQPTIDNVVEKNVKERKHILVASLDPSTGEVIFSGDHGWISAIGEEIELKEKMVAKLKEAASKGNSEKSFVVDFLPKKSYAKLSFDIKKPNKAPQKTIRDTLNHMHNLKGYGLNKLKKFGKGLPPKGWPAEGFEWSNFRGSTNTKTRLLSS